MKRLMRSKTGFRRMFKIYCPVGLLMVLLFSCNEPKAQRGVQAHQAAETDLQVLVGNGLGETLSSLAYPTAGGPEASASVDLVRTGMAPSDMAIQGGKAYLVNALSHTIQVIHLESMRTERTISVGLGKNPMALALKPDVSPPMGYVSCFVAGEVLRVDLGPGGGVKEAITLPDSLPSDPGIATKAFPGELCIQGDRLFVTLSNLQGGAGGLRAGGPGAVAVIDVNPDSPAYHTVSHVLTLSGRDTTYLAPVEGQADLLMAVSAGDFDNAVGFVGNGMVEFIRTTDLSVAGHMPLDAYAGGAAPFEGLIHGRNGYLADARTGRIVLFDAEKALARISQSKDDAVAPDLSSCLNGAIALPGAAGTLSYASGIAVGGNTLFVLEFNSDRLFSISTETHSITNSWLIGDGPDVIGVWRPNASASPAAEWQGLAWFGRTGNGRVAVLDDDGTHLENIACNGDGLFKAALPAGTYEMAFQADHYALLATGESRPWPQGRTLRSLLMEGEADAAITPLTELSFSLAEQLDRDASFDVQHAASRLSRHLGGIPLFVSPDDPLTAAVEGNRNAGLAMAAICLLAQTHCPDDPFDFLAALALDGADGRFDGASHGGPVMLSSGAPLPKDAFTAAMADALEAFALSPQNLSGGLPPSGLLDYLRLTTGILPPASGHFDFQAPLADAGPDQTVQAGTPVALDGRGSSDDMGIAIFQWDFHDADGFQVDAQGPLVYATFETAGQRIVTLKVMDDAGNMAVDTITVTITDAPGESLTITPRQAFLETGESIKLSARDANGDLVPAVWFTTDDAVATVDGNGRLEAAGSGQALIQCVYQGKRSSALVFIDQLGQCVFYDNQVFAISPGISALTVYQHEGSHDIPLPDSFLPGQLGIWGGRYAFMAGRDDCLVMDLYDETVAAVLNMPQLTHLTACGDVVFALQQGTLVGILPDSWTTVSVEGPGPLDALQALGKDHWGRLWTATGDTVTIYGPDFLSGLSSKAGQDVMTLTGGIRFRIPQGSIKAFYFSPRRHECIVLDGRSDSLYVVQLPLLDSLSTNAAPVDISPTIINVTLQPEGLGLSHCFGTHDGSLVVESRQAGLKYIVYLDADGAITSEPSTTALTPFTRAADMAAHHASGWPPIFASTLIACDITDNAGTFMNPLLGLGHVRGGGMETGSTHTISLGGPATPSDGGPPQHGGSLTLGFGNRLVVDGPGPDLVIFENAFNQFGGQGTYCEAMIVQVSQDGETWHEFPWQVNDTLSIFSPERYKGLAGVTPVRANFSEASDLHQPMPPSDPAAGGDRFDLARLGLAWIRFVRLLDAGDWVIDAGSMQGIIANGADLDAVCAVYHANDPVGARTMDETPPEAVIRIPAGPFTADQVIALDGSFSSDDREVVYYAWDLDHDNGDFTLTPEKAFHADAMGPAVEWTPRTAGDFTLSLLVFDGYGNTARAAISVAVHAALHE